MTRLLNGLPLVALRIVLLALAALITRAPLRRVVDALVGGALVSVLTAAWDVLAHRAGWWTHPAGAAYGPSASPRAYYFGVGLWYGAGVSLLGWALAHRFGIRGLSAFLAALAAYGPVRDYIAAKRFGVIAFGPGVGPFLADAVSWSSTAAAGHIVMRLLSEGKGYVRSRARANGREA